MKTKNIVAFALSGFSLSLLISIFSTHNIFRSFLRGLIFGVIFGLIGFLIEIANEKLLAVESGEFFQDMAKNNSKPSSPEGSGKVDITISDENLTDDGSALHFTVENNKQALREGIGSSEKKSEGSDSSLGKSSSVSSNNKIEDAGLNMQNIPSASAGASSGTKKSDTTDASSLKQDFKSVNLASEVLSSNGSDTQNPVVQSKNVQEAAENQEVKADSPMTEKERIAQERAAEKEAQKKEIDELPDLGDFSVDSKSGDENEVIEDSDFAQTENPSSGRVSYADGDKAKDHDVETMAKAIRTLLKKDD